MALEVEENSLHFLRESERIMKCLYSEESSRFFLMLFWILSKYFVDLGC